MPRDVLQIMSQYVENPRRKARIMAPCRLCGGPTKGQIPACLEHLVDVMPYAAKVAAELSDRIDEAARLNRGVKARPWGRLADEIVDMLGLGPLPIGQLSRLLDLDLDAAYRLAESMERAGRITTRRHGRSLELRRAETQADDD